METETILADPWTIGFDLHRTICALVPSGSNILELGSGAGTGLLAKHYTMYSVEHNREWLDRYDSHYIHAWCVDGWYNRELLEGKLPREYTALLVDGPPGPGNRKGMVDNLDLFDLAVWLFFDDVHREGELEVYRKLCDIISRPYVECADGTKKFGIVAAKGVSAEVFAYRIKALRLNVVTD